MSCRLLFATASIGLLLSLPSAVPAATTTATLNVSASVSASCTLTATAITFGALTSAISTTPVNATGTITVNCTPSDALSIALNGGSNATSGQRHLANGANTLTYNINQPNAAGTAPSSPLVAWGDSGATATGAPYTTTGTGANQVLNVYGVVPAQTATLAAGNYIDLDHRDADLLSRMGEAHARPALACGRP